MGLLRWLLVTLALTLPATAQTLPGLDDPAFRAAWESLLTRDDPADLRALHDLAAKGNQAALVALPLAQRWLPLQPDRAELRRIGPDLLRDLGRAAWKPAALWADGEMSQDPRHQMERVLWLYDLGEARKADALLNRQLNHSPLPFALPEGFLDSQASAMVKARLLIEQLARGDRKGLAPLQTLLDRDRIEGWMVLAVLNARVDLTAGPPIQANLRLPANAGARLKEGKAAFDLLWHDRPRPPLPADVLDMAQENLLPLPEFAPARALCAARCTSTAPACEAAFLSLLGAPHPSTAQLTPLNGLMSEADFFATPRGAQALLAPALKLRLSLNRLADPLATATTDPALQAARGLDACLADAALLALRGP